MLRSLLVIILTLSSVSLGRLSADINGDCVVDEKDLKILIRQWRQIDEDCMANRYLSFDGVTGGVVQGEG